MALLDANRVMALHRTPATLSWYSVKTGITHQGQGSDWKHIDLSPSKQLAVGISPGGTMQVLALKSGKIVCDHSRGAEVTIAGGFEDDTTLWTLGYVKGGFNKLELRQVDVNRCQITRRRPLGLGKTSNLLPRWVSGAKAFVFNALTDKGWGAIMVYVDQNRANKMLWPDKTPFVYVSDHGHRFGLKDYSRVRLFEVANDGRITPTGEETKDFMVLCREHSLLYSYKGGWSDYIIAATVQPSAFNSIQPQVAACYGHQLLLIAYQHMNLIDLKTVKITQAWQLPDRNPAIRLIDERRAILGGGETGWRLLRF